MVYFDDLNRRSAGTVGHDGLYLSENGTGPNDSLHAMEGIFVLHDTARGRGERVEGLSLLDVAQTALQLRGVPVPGGIEGRPVAGTSGGIA